MSAGAILVICLLAVWIAYCIWHNVKKKGACCCSGGKDQGLVKKDCRSNSCSGCGGCSGCNTKVYGVNVDEFGNPL